METMKMLLIWMPKFEFHSTSTSFWIHFLAPPEFVLEVLEVLHVFMACPATPSREHVATGWEGAAVRAIMSFHMHSGFVLATCLI